MLNPATHIYRNRLNEFTESIVTNQLLGVKTRVRLRNDTIVEPIHTPAEDATCEDAFFTEDYKYCWNLDGTSVTSRSFDMMEII